MPTFSTLAAVFAMLIGLAFVLRWRYRTWFLLLLASLGLAGAGLYRLRDQGQRATAPVQGKAEAQRLRSLPWPASLDQQARLVPSFRGVDASNDADALGLIYSVSLQKSMVGDTPFHFATVSDALAWRDALGSYSSPAHRKQWQEIGDLSDRAMGTLINVTLPEFAPQAVGAAPPVWPNALQKTAPLSPFSRYLGNGLWIAPKGSGSSDNIVQFPILVTHKGQGKIIDAQISLGVFQPREGAQAPSTRPLLERFACWVSLRNMLPGETRLLKCEVGTLYEKSPGTQRLSSDVAQLRAGKLSIWTGLTVGMDYEPLTAPQAQPVNPEAVRLHAELKAADALSTRQAERWEQILTTWLWLAGLALLGFAVPGVRGQAVPLRDLIGQVVAIGALALAGVWLYMSRQGAMTGYAPLVAFLVAALVDALFIGGVLLGNVVVLRRGHLATQQ